MDCIVRAHVSGELDRQGAEHERASSAVEEENDARAGAAQPVGHLANEGGAVLFRCGAAALGSDQVVAVEKVRQRRRIRLRRS